MELEELMAMKIADEKIVGDTSPDALFPRTFSTIRRIIYGWMDLRTLLLVNLPEQKWIKMRVEAVFTTNGF